MASKIMCSYDTYYLDLETDKHKKFVCKNLVHGASPFCKFHDPSYLTPITERGITRSFMRKVSLASKKPNSPLICIGYYLPQIKLHDLTIKSAVYFAQANFQGGASFENIKFKKSVQFSKSKFKDLEFSDSDFDKRTDFSDSEFNGKLSIFNVTFKQGTNFERTKIYDATFHATFEKITTFANSEITETAFSLSTFDDVIFSDAVIEKESFYDCKFNKAVFENAQINNTSFDTSTFNKAVFENAQINNTSFDTSTFKEAHFSNSKFTKKINFQNSEFIDRTYFRNCNFQDTVTFENSIFKEEVNFEGTIFEDYANLRNVQFFEQEKVKFDGNLSNVSFLKTNITRVKFGNNVIWSNKVKDPYAVLDERILNERAENLQLEDVMDVYRHLKDNCEFYSRYDDSGAFYIRELELKRKFANTSISNERKTIRKNGIRRSFSILAVFYLISKYGQSYSRPLYFAGAGIAFSTLYFWTAGFSNNVLTHNDGMLAKSFTNSLLRSTSAFFPFLTFGNYHAASDFILRISLLPITGTFILSLKRRLERKLRH